MRSCRVSVTGLDGVTHSVDVQASSLFEAASVALTAFRQQPRLGDRGADAERTVPSGGATPADGP